MNIYMFVTGYTHTIPLWYVHNDSLKSDLRGNVVEGVHPGRSVTHSVWTVSTLDI